MDKWNLIIDVAKCENCNNCVLAAKDELVGNNFPGYSAPHAAQGTGAIRIERTTRGTTPMVDAAYVPRMCNHCDNAPCLKAGADGAVRKRDDHRSGQGQGSSGSGGILSLWSHGLERRAAVAANLVL
jgi:Fe-S-cluster-containing dehydrogenase component